MLATAAPSSAFAQSAAEAAAKLRALIVDDGCSEARGDEEIVVCGKRADADKFRLPLPVETLPGRGTIRGEVPSASPDRLASGKCGIFAGDRRCGKAEGLLYGYGGGRDPLSLLTAVVTGIVDSDAMAAPPPAIPKAIDRSE